MRHGRAKQARKTLQFFQRAIGLHAPYNILLDGTFAVAMIQSKLPLNERLDRLLQHGSSYQLFMTQSSLQELETLSQHAETQEGENVFETAQKWAKEHCRILLDMPPAPDELSQAQSRFAQHQADYDHQNNDEHSNSRRRISQKRRKREEIEWTVAQKDMLRLVTHAVVEVAGKKINLPPKSATAETANDDGPKTTDNQKSTSSHSAQQERLFLVASQDETVLGILRYFTIPLIRLARGSVLLLEQPSKLIQSMDRRVEQQKWTVTSAKAGAVTPQEQSLLEVMAKEQDEKERQQQEKAKTVIMGRRVSQNSNKKRKAKGPNPLSCKKKKDGDATGGKRRRKKSKTQAAS